MTFTSLSRLLAVSALAAALLPAAVMVDASKKAPAPLPLAFAAGGKSPDGHTLGVNNRYMMLDGKPWFPVMGEFQFTRYNPADWEQEILKMKAGGLRIISTYIFWIHHEEIEGQFDWSDRRDLRRFVQLAGKHGMYVWARVGPWDHGEVRNGGLPDWALTKSQVRQNDPAYLQYVRRFYGEIGKQLKGLCWKDGGPVIGVQIENEYHERGPGKGEEHMLTLRGMAREAGMDAAFYTATGWDNAAFPARELLPVFGGYPDGFWYTSRQPLLPSPMYFFSAIRRDEDVGDDLCSKRPDLDAKYEAYPFFTAEMAGGMELSYHRRPLMSADDIASLDIVKLGSGVTLYGYYMFHGGTNPDGKKTTLQESQATGYPNDLPLKTYDFQAPLGEFGQMHPSFRDLKSIHLFLRDFGADLAPMAAYFPQDMPRAKLDSDTPRAGVRSDSKSAYVFLNNYQKDHPLPERKNFQVQLKLASRTVNVPSVPLDVPGGAYTFWPVNLEIGGANLEYATAQPLAKLDSSSLVAFFAWPGIAPEFAFTETPGITIEAPHAKVQRKDGRVSITGLDPGFDAAIQIRGPKGRVTEILLFSREQARNIWKAPLAGKERLIYSTADLYFEGDRIHLASTDAAALRFAVFPAVQRQLTGFTGAGRQGIFERFTSTVQPVKLEPVVRQIAEPGKAAPAVMGKEVALVPEEAAFAAAGRWSVRVPGVNSPGLGEVFLRVSYQGDIARIYAGNRLITDDFYHGAPWEIGLRRIPAADLQQGLEVKILPLRQDAPIYLAKGARPELPEGGQVAAIQQVQLMPEYQTVADLAARQ